MFTILAVPGDLWFRDFTQHRFCVKHDGGFCCCNTAIPLCGKTDEPTLLLAPLLRKTRPWLLVAVLPLFTFCGKAGESAKVVLGLQTFRLYRLILRHLLLITFSTRYLFIFPLGWVKVRYFFTATETCSHIWHTHCKRPKSLYGSIIKMLLW